MQQPHGTVRTQGDGMETVLPGGAEARAAGSKHLLGDTLIYRPDDTRYSPAPPVVTGKVVHLVPQSRNRRRILDGLKLKEPKFVPYEPYKAAVTPLVPLDRKGRAERKRSGLAASLASLSLRAASEPGVETGPPGVDGELEEEKKALQTELNTLKEENSQLESQLKFQAQVNGELKALLVAAVGEDMQARVNHLAEDKLQLARALLGSAQRLSTHREQTEWLAGQCEVWRSRFLASGLVVEELARWRAALQEALGRLLEERRALRDSLLPTHRNLSVLRENFEAAGGRPARLQSSSVLDVSAANRALSEALVLQLLGGWDRRVCRQPDLTGLDASTRAERVAEALLASPVPLLRSDAACSAILGAAVAVGGHGLPASCCPHCSGEVKLV
ncbi:golgin-45 [Bacillus rossius redtenbacheri]|uniref:golgin-45 n=1 Tax=Bacillus rossius redtenbacheri TaxID=93214 RepID=UPI002FDD6B9B